MIMKKWLCRKLTLKRLIVTGHTGLFCVIAGLILTSRSQGGLLMKNSLTPKELGYHFPAEFAPHEATWLSWPHKEGSWPGKIHAIYPYYGQFIKELTSGERVCINVNDFPMKSFAENCLLEAGVDLGKIEFFFHPTDDAWCRDHGPAFLINPKAEKKKVIVDWGYNAWGGKYPPFDLDDVIPAKIGAHFNIPVYHPGIVMAG